MLVNELLVIPTADTLNSFRQIFSGCPFDMNLDKAYVVLNISESEMEPEPENLYSAHCGSMNVWYDQATGMSSLILPLVSPSMTERVQSLQDKSPSAFYGGQYFPHMILVQDFPPISRRYSGFIGSISDTLNAQQTPIFFDAELCVQKEYYAPPQMDYYASQMANHYRR